MEIIESNKTQVEKIFLSRKETLQNLKLIKANLTLIPTKESFSYEDIEQVN